MALFVGLISFAAGAPVSAEQVVRIGGGNALFNNGGGTYAAVLVPGGNGSLGIRSDGRISEQRQSTLVRNRRAMAGQGVSTLLIDRGVGIGQAVSYLRNSHRTVAVVAISRGANRIREITAAQPEGVVLISAELDRVQRTAGPPSSLPRTLVIHHRNDRCHSTSPGLVEPFRAWAGSRVQVHWMTGGAERGNPCWGLSHHGLLGLDGALSAATTGFIRSLR